VFQQPRIVVVVWNGENPGHKSIQESNLPLYIPPARYITLGVFDATRNLTCCIIAGWARQKIGGSR
jgi:hypothetical protein